MLSSQYQQGTPVSSHWRSPELKHPEITASAWIIGDVHVSSAMDKVTMHGPQSQSSGSHSGYSDLTGLENETDEFGKLLLRNHREQQQSRAAGTSSIPRAFPKARPRHQLAERLKRGGVQSEQETETKMATVAAEQPSHALEPQVTVPWAWGRKAKPQQWLRDNNASPVLNVDNELAQHEQENNGPRHSPTRQGLHYNLGDTTPPSMRRKSGISPSSMRHMNTTIQDLLEAEDQDFSTDSLLASTPAAASRFGYRRIDELTRREIETVEKQAVTTRNLDQISERSPNSIRKRPSLQFSKQSRSYQAGDGSPSPVRPTTAPSGSVRSRIPRRRSLIGKENIPENGDAATAYKSIETVALNDRAAQAVSISTLSRPSHKRNDSITLLKKLARVSSMSPSPQPRELSTSPTKLPRLSRTKSMPEDQRSSVPQLSNGVKTGTRAIKTRTQDDLGQESLLADRVLKDEDIVRRSLELSKDTEDLERVVTGSHAVGSADETVQMADSQAYDNVEHVSQLTNKLQSQKETLTSMQPNAAEVTSNEHLHGKSALADIIQEDQDQTNPQFGESTLASLEHIVNPTKDNNDATLSLDLDEDMRGAIKTVNDASQTLTQDEKSRREEMIAMESMNKHLRNARTSIKDANRGLRRAEDRVDGTKLDTAAEAATEVVIQATKATECPMCARHISVWRALWSETKACFFTWDPSSKYRIRLTWLGLACLLWLGWLISETTLCSYFCHPEYADTMIDFGVDPDAPIFPFVIPTLVFRPIRWLWQPVCEGFYYLGSAFWHTLFGENASSTDAPIVKPAFGNDVRHAYSTTSRDGWIRATAASVSAGTARVAQSTIDVLDELGSMWDDELIL